MTTLAKPEIQGNINSLYGIHGEIPTSKDKVTTALSFMSGMNRLDIDYLNKISETGGIYVKSNGTILDTFTESDENIAKYKLLPTGMKLKHTETPLFASFMKVKNSWEGAYIGTAISLFQMYYEHYMGNKDTFSMSYMNIFSNDKDITGFGLDSLLSEDKHELQPYKEVSSVEPVLSVYLDTDTTVNSLEAAIKKMQTRVDNTTAKTPKKNQMHKSKDQRKQERLQAHLNKIKEKESLKQSTEESKSVQTVPVKSVTTEVTPILPEVKLQIPNQTQSDLKSTTSQSTTNSTVTTIRTTGDTSEQPKPISIKPEIQSLTKNKLETTVEPEPTETLEQELSELPAEQAEELEKVLDELSSDNDEIRVSRALKQCVKNSLTHSVYERLLIKEHWEEDKSRNRLAFYLKGLFALAFMNQIGHQSIRGNGYLFSNDKSVCLVNTNLIDEYGNFVYLIDHTPSNPDFYDKDVELFNSKSDLLLLGFDSKEIKKLPEPMQIVKKRENLIFNGKIEDFDFNDIQHMNHIINERKYRFPGKYKNESSLYLCEKIRFAVERAIKISVTDYKYIIPKYDFTRNKVQFLIPLYFDTTVDGRPDLVIVADEQTEGHWQVCTVLYVEDAYDSARLLCKPSEEWLKLSEDKAQHNKSNKVK
jgi:hypothetical protein